MVDAHNRERDEIGRVLLPAANLLVEIVHHAVDLLDHGFVENFHFGGEVNRRDRTAGNGMPFNVLRFIAVYQSPERAVVASRVVVQEVQSPGRVAKPFG